MSMFRVTIKMEVELEAKDQASAHDECQYILGGMEDMAQAGGPGKPFTKVGLATAHATVQG